MERGFLRWESVGATASSALQGASHFWEARYRGSHAVLAASFAHREERCSGDLVGIDKWGIGEAGGTQSFQGSVPDGAVFYLRSTYGGGEVS